MRVEARIPLFDLVTCVADTVDLISPALGNHQMRVAYIACSIAAELEWSHERRSRMLVAAAMHDIGGFGMQERSDLLLFELAQPHYHAKVGHRLLQTFPPFQDMAELVRCHHVPWDGGAGIEFEQTPVPEDSHLLHLADRISVLIEPDAPVLWQSKAIAEKVRALAPSAFVPEFVEGFERVALKDFFWIDAASHSASAVLRRRVMLDPLDLDLDGLSAFANLFRRIIDFRSRFTATHSSGVAATAVALARLAGFSERECRLMQIAGYLHDLGKLAIPREILQKPSKLDAREYDIMRGHVYHTYRILEPIAELDTIRTWSALHQEYLDGTGYPFRLRADDLPLGSRIMAVADVFTALAEDRPYRAGLPREQTTEILAKLGEMNKLDAEVIALLAENYDDIAAARADAQEASIEEYDAFMASVG